MSQAAGASNRSGRGGEIEVAGVGLQTAAGSVAECALAIMTKAPRAGSVKTRLVPPLTPNEAAALQACFLKDTAESIAALGAAGCAGVAVYTPEGTEHLFYDLLPPGFRLVPQRGEGLGERLRNAVLDLLAAGYASVCLIDSDSPTLPQKSLARAVAALKRPGERVILGPADDGGYYLIGVKAAHHTLFAGITWSTNQVFAQTVERAEAGGLDIEVLPSWYDVDDGPSLDRLREELFGPADGKYVAPRGYHAPHTRGFLTELLRHARRGSALESVSRIGGRGD